MIKAIIFDMDGTLVDTLPMYMRAYIKILRDEMGLPITEEQVGDKFGKRATEIMRELLDDCEYGADAEEVQRIINLIRDKFKDSMGGLQMLPGAKEVLGVAKREYKVALATSSRKYAADAIMEKFNLEFDARVTGDEVENSKPAPDTFLLAAERLGIEPEYCIVIEDACYGLDAAKAAGMKCLGVLTGASTREEMEEESKPDWILDSLEELDFDILN